MYIPFIYQPPAQNRDDMSHNILVLIQSNGNGIVFGRTNQ